MSETNAFIPSIDPSNVTVQAMFGQVLQQKIQSGALEIALAKQADKLIEECASDVLRSYGDVGKAVKEAMTKAITPNLDDLADFPKYHDFVMKRLRIAAQCFCDQRLTEVLDKELAAILAELPEQITLSSLLKMVADGIREHSDPGDHYDEQMTLIIENTSFGYRHIFIGKESGKTKFDCEYRVDIDKDCAIYSMIIDGSDIKNTKFAGPFYNFERLMMNLYAMKGKLLLDCGDDPYSYDLIIESYD
jgi:hypothetical protein